MTYRPRKSKSWRGFSESTCRMTIVLATSRINMPDDDRSSDFELDWSLRVSRRARHARLQVKPFGGLEVVIPARFPRHQVAALVDRHAAWARRQLARQASLRQAIRLPDELSLAFDNSTTPIVYRGDSSFDAVDNRCGESIVIDGVDQRARIDKLRRCIRRRAQQSLPLAARRRAGAAARIAATSASTINCCSCRRRRSNT